MDSGIDEASCRNREVILTNQETFYLGEPIQKGDGMEFGEGVWYRCDSFCSQCSIAGSNGYEKIDHP